MMGGRCFACGRPARRVELKLSGRAAARLERMERGYHEAVVEGVRPGDRYWFSLDGGADRPDPASRSQPDGVHGASEVVEEAFAWSGGFGGAGLPLESST